MLRCMRSLIGLGSSKRLSEGRAPSSRRRRTGVLFKPPDMWDTVHEVAIYIHRFHNLDLFQQGWYQMKISMRCEDGVQDTQGIPSRVVQYEAPDLVPEHSVCVWRIDDADNSFYTQPFRIKYARQDVLLAVMVSFNFPLVKRKSPLSCAVILKFELLHTLALNNGFEMQAFPAASPSVIHEFRIPPKALLGLHSYCPVHFDAFHAVLVDLSIHIIFMKAGTFASSKKVPSHQLEEEIADDPNQTPNQLLTQGMGSTSIELVKSLLSSREILLGELQKMSKAIGQTIDDITDASLNLGDFEIVGSSLRPNLVSFRSGNSVMKSRSGQLAGALQIILGNSSDISDLESDVVLYTLSKEELFDAFLTVGNQLSFIWNAFLKFHRTNREKILEHLHRVWSVDRKAEWSIWMIFSKIEIPHRYLKSCADDSSHHILASVPRKPSDDRAQSAVARAELHRRSIGQMKINNSSIQDIQIFGDPLHIPVLLIEHDVMEIPSRSSGNKTSVDSANEVDSSPLTVKPGEKVIPQLFGHKRHGRILKVVVFVHGFQGHHLDLRLIRNQWLLIDPAADCLMSEVNEERTSGDFREMGKRLAEEVTAFLRKRIDKISRNGVCKDIKISFVGHSIGNIIIRSALADSIMGPFLKHLYTYVSISGPHLGYWYSSNSLFNSGLWLLKKLKGAQCIHQLTFSDDPDLQNTFFYKLCKQKTLENFKNIILLSSPQDGYVPYHSARIELCQASSWDNSKKAQVYMEMLNNCLDQIRSPSVGKRTFMRCDVNFDTSSQGKNLNTIIGRAAHIEFLETDVFMKFVMWSFPEIFL